MSRTATPTTATLARVEELYKRADWSQAYSLLEHELAAEADPRSAARLKIALVNGYNFEDFKRGLLHGDEKHPLLDSVDAAAAETGDDLLRAASLYQRGMALHIQFVMATPDLEREEQCFADSAALFRKHEDRAAASLATAMHGIFHHVDRLDRPTAEPLLWSAYEEATQARAAEPGRAEADLGLSEAARHLGQIRQELGDPEGGLALLEESLRVRRESGWISLVPSALHARAFARLEAGDHEGARADLAEARALAEPMDARLTLAMISRTEADLEFSLVAPNVWQRTHP